jgi:peptidoglycan/LPS O-acetylase OafA/YrhL
MSSSEGIVANRNAAPAITVGPAQQLAAPRPDAAARPSAHDNRLPFIHGLRGVAASAVTLFHLYEATPVSQQVVATIPAILDGMLRLGFLGVDLFFAISGFVISLTLYKRLATLREWGRFFLRRQLRLDPPYWTAILISIVSAVVLNALRPSTHAPVPSVTDLIIHLFYLQDFFGIKAIAGIFWTLCLEIQFYLFFGALMLLLARSSWSGRAFGWLMLPLYVLSIACFWGLVPFPRGLFIARWFEFFTGVVIFLYWRKQLSLLQVAAYLGALLAVLVINPVADSDTAQATAATVLLIGLIFLLAVESGRVKTWFDVNVLRYLGDISYSLYLMHALVGIRLLKLVVHEDSSAPTAWLLYFVALTMSVAASDIMFRLIERPSMRLSHRLKWRGT